MSKERFDRLDQTLAEIKQSTDRSEERFVRIDQTLTEVRQRLDQSDQRCGKIDQRFDQVDEQLAELRRHMGVLHEEALGRIAGSRESPKRRTPSAESTDALRRRLDPLEALVPVVREHGATLKRHETEIDRLRRRR
jgi:chromosome segregation ATPase